VLCHHAHGIISFHNRTKTSGPPESRLPLVWELLSEQAAALPASWRAVGRIFSLIRD
jgi:hypothetical protein